MSNRSINRPDVRSGKFSCGVDCVIGDNVVVDVAEEVVFGDRCVIPLNAYLGGRSISVGNDFYGYSWEWKRLDIGRGRRDDEYARLTVGDRCTFHDNRIDLADSVSIGDDVGLSPEVTIYTHGYWQTVLKGYPCIKGHIAIHSRTVIGYRSTILPGISIEAGCVVGAGSVVAISLEHPDSTYGGVPAKFIRAVTGLTAFAQKGLLQDIIADYARTLEYRNLGKFEYTLEWPWVGYRSCRFNVLTFQIVGEEDEGTDDFRDYVFRRGLRFYTKRPFRKLPRRVGQ